MEFVTSRDGLINIAVQLMTGVLQGFLVLIDIVVRDGQLCYYACTAASHVV